MSLSLFSRRQLLKNMACLMCARGLAGCQSSEQLPQVRGKVALGPVAGIPQGLSPYTLARVAVMRRGKTLQAISLVCTHQNCMIRPQIGVAGNEPHSFACTCHGSKFDNQGRVLNGPAAQDLPFYRLELNHEQILVVDFSRIVPAEWQLEIA